MKDIKEEPIIEEEIKKTTTPLRQVIIETDGDSIKIVKAEVSGKIELIAMLQHVISYINNQK